MEEKKRGILKSEIRVKCPFNIRNAGAFLSLRVGKRRIGTNDTFLHVPESHRVVEVRMTDRQGIRITVNTDKEKMIKYRNLEGWIYNQATDSKLAS